MGPTKNQIKLVTFDVFGTLIDWQKTVEKVVPAGYGDFLALSSKRQLCHEPNPRYADVLADTLRELVPQADPQVLTAFANGFGNAEPFPDVEALQLISQQVPLGCLSNSDFRHQQDVQRQLGVIWQVCVLSEGVGYYKPDPRAWDVMVETVVSSRSIKPEEWLHVAAYVDFDLRPAKERGLRTAFIPRAGGSPAHEAMDLGVDMIASDLWQFADGLRQEWGEPLWYRVTANTLHKKVSKQLVNWLDRQHARDVLKVDGVLRFDIRQETDEIIHCDYLFQSQAAYDRYVETVAPRLRQDSANMFPDHLVKFSRSFQFGRASGWKR